MSNKIYLLRFNGGAGGDFLSYQISNDINFYPLTLISNKDNTWDLENPFQKFKHDEMETTIIQNQLNELSELIKSNQELQDKNLLIRTHYTGSLSNFKLSNLSIVNLTMFGKILYLSYFLLFIKRYLKTLYVSELQESINYARNRFNVDNQIDQIVQRGFCYSFERYALMRGLQNSYDFIEEFFNRYRAFCLPKIGAINLNVGKLYQNPELNVVDFSKEFNMKNPLDSNLLQTYFEKNTQLFQTNLGKLFDSYNSDKEFIYDLTNFVKHQAPNSYV